MTQTLAQEYRGIPPLQEANKGRQLPDLRKNTRYSVRQLPESDEHPAIFLGYVENNLPEAVFLINQGETPVERRFPSDRISVDGKLVTIAKTSGGSD